MGRQSQAQADFWPSHVFTGQFYSESTSMRIPAWHGQVVEGFGERSKRLMASIADRQALGAIVAPRLESADWRAANNSGPSCCNPDARSL